MIQNEALNFKLRKIFQNRVGKSHAVTNHHHHLSFLVSKWVISSAQLYIKKVLYKTWKLLKQEVPCINPRSIPNF